MAKMREAILTLKVDSSEALKGLREYINTAEGVTEVNKKVKQTNKEMEDSSKSMAASIASGVKRAAIELGVLALGYRGVRDTLLGSIAAAARQQDAQLMLEQSLRRTGDASEFVTKSLKATTEQIAKETVYSHEAVMTEMAWAKNMGVTTQSLGQVSKAAAGLAALLGVDLSTAYMMIIRAGYGYTTQLARHGIYIKENASYQEKMATIMQKASEGYKIAEERAKTATGRYIQFKEAVEETGAAFGAQFLPGLTKSAEAMTNWLRDNESMFRYWGQIAGAYIGQVKDELIAFAQYASKDFNGAMGLVWDKFLQGMEALAKGAIALAWRMGKAIADAVWDSITGKGPSEGDIHARAMAIYKQRGGRTYEDTTYDPVYAAGLGVAAPQGRKVELPWDSARYVEAQMKAEQDIEAERVEKYSQGFRELVSRYAGGTAPQVTESPSPLPPVEQPSAPFKELELSATPFTQALQNSFKKGPPLKIPVKLESSPRDQFDARITEAEVKRAQRVTAAQAGYRESQGEGLPARGPRAYQPPPEGINTHIMEEEPPDAKKQSSLDKYLESLARETEMLGKVRSAREADTALVKAQEAAEADYANGLRDLLDPINVLTEEEYALLNARIEALNAAKTHDLLRTMEMEIDTQNALVAAVKKGPAAYEEEVTYQQLLNKAMSEGIPITQDLETRLRELAKRMQDLKNEQEHAYGDDFFGGFLGGLDEANRKMKTLGETGAEVAQAMRAGILDSLTDAVFEAKDLGDSLEQVGIDMAKILYRHEMESLVSSLTGGGGGSSFSGLLANAIVGGIGGLLGGSSPVINPHLAFGGILNYGRYVAFANGDVVERPTLFSMRDGRRGLMGEAGTEVIMPARSNGGGYSVTAYGQGGAFDIPLIRGPNGRLGVRVDRAFARGDVLEGPLPGGRWSWGRPNSTGSTSGGQKIESGDSARLDRIAAGIERLVAKKSATNVGIALDPKLIGEWADTPDGERKLVKIMSRNKQILKS